MNHCEKQKELKEKFNECLNKHIVKELEFRNIDVTPRNIIMWIEREKLLEGEIYKLYNDEGKVIGYMNEKEEIFDMRFRKVKSIHALHLRTFKLKIRIPKN